MKRVSNLQFKNGHVHTCMCAQHLNDRSWFSCMREQKIVGAKKSVCVYSTFEKSCWFSGGQITWRIGSRQFLSGKAQLDRSNVWASSISVFSICNFTPPDLDSSVIKHAVSGSTSFVCTVAFEWLSAIIAYIPWSWVFVVIQSTRFEIDRRVLPPAIIRSTHTHRHTHMHFIINSILVWHDRSTALQATRKTWLASRLACCVCVMFEYHHSMCLYVMKLRHDDRGIILIH